MAYEGLNQEKKKEPEKKKNVDYCTTGHLRIAHRIDVKGRKEGTVAEQKGVIAVKCLLRLDFLMQI